jgi:hypothetical protein
MKIIRQQDGQFEMRMEKDEWTALSDLLSQYPLTPAEHHSLNSEDHPDPDLKESDQWLRESVSSHHTERETQLKQWVKSVKPDDSGSDIEYPATFDAERADWLIEILNDLRVGSWLSLDCPSPEEVSEKSWQSKDWPTIWAMEVSGMYQSILLKALS